MTRFERDYQEAKNFNGVEVMMRRKKELADLRKKLKVCKNKFRAQCILQEIERLSHEYDKIDELF